MVKYEREFEDGVLFNVRGDSVYFLGISFYEWADGNACPWFKLRVGKTAANYISNRNRVIRYDNEAGTFVVETEDRLDFRRSVVINGEMYYDFGGLAEWDIHWMK